MRKFPNGAKEQLLTIRDDVLSVVLPVNGGPLARGLARIEKLKREAAEQGREPQFSDYKDGKEPAEAELKAVLSNREMLNDDQFRALFEVVNLHLAKKGMDEGDPMLIKLTMQESEARHLDLNWHSEYQD